MYGELVPCGGGDSIPLLKTKLLIGRRGRCDVMLDFPNVSSHHCELEFLNGYWFVRDLGSRNGIKVNGASCDSKWLLPGDVLHVAKHRFEVQYTPTSDGPPPEEENPFARSLLEKAGLGRNDPAERRNHRTSPKVQSPAAPRPKQAPDDDDIAMGFLTDEE